MRNVAVAERSSTAGNQKFFGNLESLRGIAALSVVLIHCIGCFITVSAVSGVPAAVLQYFLDAVNGRNAVVLFFVLSGFVLSESLSRSGVTVRASLAFIVRRAFRILPLAYAMMAASTAYLLLFTPGANLSRFAHAWLLSGYFHPALADVVANIEFQDYRLNTVYWTLYVELMGSLFFIPLYWITSTAPASARLLILLALIAASFIGRDGTLFPQYFFCFELGVLAYRLRDFVDSHAAVVRKMGFIQPIAAALGIWIVAYAHSTIAIWISRATGVSLDNVVLVWSQVVIEGLGAAILVFGCSGSSQIVNAILGNRPLRFLGKISFSLYCTHLLILKAVVPVWVAVFGESLIAQPLLGPLLNIGVVVPVAVLLSAFTYSQIELPGIAAGRKLCSMLLRPRNTQAAPTAA